VIAPLRHYDCVFEARPLGVLSVLVFKEVKVSLEQATKAQMGVEVIFLLFL
jgi:hypothetical protein